tara:strand:- start:669 stop:923 length:255 start_codon:yes stop_codon:yes gene_type:complete
MGSYNRELTEYKVLQYSYKVAALRGKAMFHSSPVSFTKHRLSLPVENYKGIVGSNNILSIIDSELDELLLAYMKANPKKSKKSS